MYANKIFIDIETLPPSGGGHLERIRAAIQPPGQYKKPESIAAWMAENADSIAIEEHARLGLNGLYGQVCVIGWAINDNAIRTFDLRDYPTTGEAGLIAHAFEQIQGDSIDGSNASRNLTAVGHNIDFDLRFLMQRAVRHGVAVPSCLRAAFDPEKGRYNVFDTMRVWSGFKDFVKLKDLCRELLSDDCTDIDGSEVAKAWVANPEKVVEHCKLDVERVRAIYQRMATTLYAA